MPPVGWPPTGRPEGRECADYDTYVSRPYRSRPNLWANIHILQAWEGTSIGEDGVEAFPTGGVERLVCAVVIDDFDFGQVREFGEVLECGSPERSVCFVVHGPYSQ